MTLKLSVRHALLSLLVATYCVPVVVMARDLPPVFESQPLGQQQVPPPTPAMAPPVSQLDEGRDMNEQSMVEMLIQVETLQQEVQDLRGLVETQSHELEGLRKRQRDLYVDIDRRLRQLSLSAPQAPGTAITPGAPAPPATPVPPVPPAAAATADANADLALQEQAAYQQAFNVLKEGRYEDSIDAFSRFLEQYPRGQYAANAQYWIGEANYVLRHFDKAVQEFNKVINAYADSSKVPDAMLKAGYSYYELEQWDQARVALTALAGKFPDTTAAQLAKNRLHRMKLEGK